MRKIIILALLLLPLTLWAQSTPAPKPPIGVPAGAKFFNGKWYHVFMEPGPWERAKFKCASLHGQLATVPDAATWDFIKTLSPASVWLGATDQATEGVWMWVDGTPVAFTAWTKDNPNNSGNREHFLGTITYEGKPGWNDYDKDGKVGDRDRRGDKPGEKEGKIGKFEIAGFICEWKAK